MKKLLMSFIELLIVPLIKVRYLNKLLHLKYKSHESFIFKSQLIKYFYHSYNNFRLTERCIEIPLIKNIISNENYERVLEIGNVTNHYYEEFKNTFKYKDTVDKYEKGVNVINIDISNFNSDLLYNCVLSISTFEHMDSDGGRNPDYILTSHDEFSSIAFINIDYVLNNLLANEGKFILTFPLGYKSEEIDNSIYNKEYEKFEVSSCELYLFKKTGEITWSQVKLSEGRNAKKNSVHPGVNYLVLMVLQK